MGLGNTVSPSFRFLYLNTSCAANHRTPAVHHRRVTLNASVRPARAVVAAAPAALLQPVNNSLGAAIAVEEVILPVVVDLPSGGDQSLVNLALVVTCSNSGIISLPRRVAF